MKAIRPTAENAPHARGVPIVRRLGFVPERTRAHMGDHRGWALNVRVFAVPATAALEMHAISRATTQAGVGPAGIVPIVWAGRPARERARRAGYARVGPLPAKAALPMAAVRETTQPVWVAGLVPEVGRDGFHLEFATSLRRAVGRPGRPEARRAGRQTPRNAGARRVGAILLDGHSPLACKARGRHRLAAHRHRLQRQGGLGQRSRCWCQRLQSWCWH
mmetsp:Transcript_67402/g.213279  ORF Transcript_67402/g.213279 Transcript_67402/m.213279 type:complete len:219 (-) Transcript_67402:402-1058(-)